MTQQLRFVSYNVNGIRAALKKDFIGWVGDNNFDVIGVQETKAQPAQVDLTALAELGYTHQYWHSAVKKGYSGVAIFSKVKPDLVVKGIGIERFDAEGRVIRVDFGEVTLLNCYFPSGTSGEIRQEVKYDFLEAINTHVQTLRKERPNIIIQGDYNIAHDEIDLHSPKTSKKSSGFLPEERAWMSEWFKEGNFVDAFRSQHPEEQKFSWWSYRATSRARNKGWRLDYHAVSAVMKDRIVAAELLNDAVHSDHCPCLLEISI
ncbi:MAG: exodeoxyribonuclease III [Aureispira sp.]